MRSHSENMRLYAQLIVREGLALATGQELFVFADTDQAPLVRLVAEEAHRTGAKNVEALLRDSAGSGNGVGLMGPILRAATDALDEQKVRAVGRSEHG